MQNFYTHRDNFTGDSVKLAGSEHRHATRSCRVKTGELIGVTDGCGRHVEARITAIDKHTLVAGIERDVSGRGEPAVEITVALALIKPSRFELAVEKCTELGARRFLPLVTERSVVKPGRLNIERLKKITFEAAKQSGRSWIPEVTEPVDLKDVFDHTHGTTLIALKSAEQSMESVLKRISGSEAVTLLFGPEGDFTVEESDILITGGAVPVSLGGLTLRSETAAIVGVGLCCAYNCLNR